MPRLALSRAGADQGLVVAILIGLLGVVGWIIHYPTEPDWNTLPSAKALLRLAEADCRKHEYITGECAGWPLSQLAKARAYHGDYELAMKMARSLPEPWDTITLASSWKIQFRRTGEKAEFPFDLDLVGDLMLRFDVAMTLSLAGRHEEARRLVADYEDLGPVTFMFVESYLDLAEAQFEKGNTRSAGASLNRAKYFIDRLKSSNTYALVQYTIRAANIWTKIGEIDRAKKSVTEQEENIRKLHSQGEATSLMATDMASIGRFWAQVDERERSAADFSEALQIATDDFKKLETSKSETNRFLLEEAGETLAKIGKLQRESGWKSEGAATFELAAWKLAELNDPGNKSFRSMKVADLWVQAGDFEGAMKFISQIEMPYWKCKAYGHGGMIAAESDVAVAKEFLQKALTLCDQLDHRSRGDVYSDLAEYFASAGDVDRSKHCFEKGIESARRFNPAALNWIARAQVRAGWLADAFKTIGGISDRGARLLPLAELALEATKRELGVTDK